MGQVDFGGVVKDVCLALVPELQVDDYAIVHAGFAISRLSESAAQETLKVFEQIGSLGDNAEEAEEQGQ